MAHPFPALQVHPTSGLSFPWAEYHPGGVTGSSDGQMGPDGVTFAFTMIIRWTDLATAAKELLGYSYRNIVNGSPRVSRNLPWTHPYNSQLSVKNIASIKGLILAGITDRPALDPTGGVDTGAGTAYELAQLTIHFWRPPYALLGDDAIGQTAAGVWREWLRYCDRVWQVQTDRLTREQNGMTYVSGQGVPTDRPFPGSIGQCVPKARLTRRWYEIPEECIFSKPENSTPSGLPTRLLATVTQTTNPITGYTYSAGSPIQGCVNSPIGGGTLDTESLRIWGFPIGTLLLESVEIVPRPLQLPAAVMDIPPFTALEPISQVQYDLVFHFLFFDPPYGPSVPSNYRGHNLAPYSGNLKWYAIASILGVDAATAPSGANPALTNYNYADFTDLFRVL